MPADTLLAPRGDDTANVATKSVSRSGRFTARLWHKWAGLFAFAWLAVLGGTGYVMNHREDWNWIWQHGLPAAWLSEAVVKTAESGLARHLQISPADPNQRIVAGARGVWWSDDAGQRWQASVADTALPLIINAVEPAPDWSRVWFGSHDGVWCSHDGGRTLQRFALDGIKVTALARGSTEDELVGVADRGHVFRLSFAVGGPVAVTWLKLGPAAASTVVPGTNLSRLTLDLHYGRGLLGSPWDEWLNDVAGVGLALLCMTGLLLWWLPWRWRRGRQQGRKLPAASLRRSTFVWLMGVHATWLGPVIVLPLALLFVTGVYIGHFAALAPLFKATEVSQAALPPTYALRSWDDWIECIAAYPGQPERLSVGTRTGLFTSENNGETWKTETSVSGGVLRLRRIGTELLAPNGMSGLTQRLTASGWKPLAPAGSHLAMASEVTPLGEGRYLWKHGAMLHLSDGDGRELSGHSFKGPSAEIVPFYTVASRLHTGAIFWKQWKWVNDVFAVAGLLLLGTGVVRWWRLVRPSRSGPARSSSVAA